MKKIPTTNDGSVRTTQKFEIVNYSANSKVNQAFSVVTDLFFATPALMEFLKSEKVYIADIPAYIQRGIDKGTLEIVKAKNGAIKTIVRDSETKQFVKHFDLVEDTISIIPGNLMLILGIYNKLNSIEKGIQKLNDNIKDVIKNFEQDRYARASAVQEQYQQALLFNDKSRKEQYLIQIIVSSSLTKHMIYRQLKSKVDKLIKQDSFFNNKNKEDLANEILSDFYLFNEIFMIQVLAYQELEEYYSLNDALYSYYIELSNVLTREVRLAIDEHFAEANNPFSNSLKEVLENVESANNYLVENEDKITTESLYLERDLND